MKIDPVIRSSNMVSNPSLGMLQFLIVYMHVTGLQPESIKLDYSVI